MSDKNQLVSYINEKLFNKNDNAKLHFDGTIFLNATVENLLEILEVLKNDETLKFRALTDIFGADFPGQEKRFEVVYSLLSLKNNVRVFIKINVSEGEVIPSAVEIYNGACWFEREVWDMYGVFFGNNPDLRRILTDYGFQGHPLRKDFPLSGHVQVRYDVETKKVLYEPVNLVQDFRTFDFVSPWEGTKYVLPGDEKAK